MPMMTPILDCRKRSKTLYIPKTPLDESMTFAQINVQNIKQRISLWGSCSYPMFALCFDGGICFAPETHGHDPWHTTMPHSTRRLQDKLKGYGDFGGHVLRLLVQYPKNVFLQVFLKNALEPAMQEAFHYKLKTSKNQPHIWPHLSNFQPWLPHRSAMLWADGGKFWPSWATAPEKRLPPGGRRPRACEPCSCVMVMHRSWRVPKQSKQTTTSSSSKLGYQTLFSPWVFGCMDAP